LALIGALALSGLIITQTPALTARNLKGANPRSLDNQPPIANAGGVARSSAGGPAQFNGTGSSDSDGSIVNYAWNFGDGASVSGEKEEAPAHVYANAGTYTVTLTVTDNQGATASATTAAIIGGASPSVGEPAEPTRQSLQLNGAGAFAEVPKTATLKSLTTFTAEAWVKTNSTANQQGIIERYNWLTEDNGGFVLRLIPGGKLLFGTVRNANEYEFVTGVTSLTTGGWHHVAGVFDGQQLRVYVDGNLDGAKDSTLFPAEGTASLKIGARGDDASNTFDGLIDDVKVSQGVVYQGSFKPEKHFIAGGASDSATPTTTWGVWTFDDKQTADLSGAKNDLELTGDAAFSDEINDYSYTLGNAPNTTAVQLNFDDIAAGTVVNNSYAQSHKVRFSSTNGYSVYPFYHPTQSTPQSPPNELARGSGLFSNNWFAPFIVEFTEPVNALKFYVTSCDDYGVIAYFDVYQNGNYSGYGLVYGNGPSHAPIPINLGNSNVQNVTKVVLYNITDSYGLGLDSFSYTYGTGPTPTPTPTPTPCPNSPNTCPAPTPTPLSPIINAEGNGDKSIKLTWSKPAPNIIGYKIMRRTTAPAYDTIATISNSSATVTYEDNNVFNDTNYDYVVRSLAGSLESANSNQTPASTFAPCGAAITPPALSLIQGYDWRFTPELTSSDGFVLKDIQLSGRKLAERISTPYYKLKMSNWETEARGELSISNNNGQLRSRIVGFNSPYFLSNNLIGARATFCVDRIPGSPLSHLDITQDYVFLKEGTDACEPSNAIRCSRFFPKTYYTYVKQGRNAGDLLSLNIPQRLHIKVVERDGIRGSQGNSVGVFRDCDLLPGPFPITHECSFGAIVFADKDNPVTWEFDAKVVKNGLNQYKWDNIHITSENEGISEPPRLNGGCPYCAHIHWRWGTAAAILAETPWVPGFYGNFNLGRLIDFDNSLRDLEIATTLARAGEEDPNDFHDLKRRGEIESLRVAPNYIPDGPKDIVVWYSSTGHRQADRFFGHGLFFAPLSATNLTQPLNESNTPVTDGPVAVTYTDVFESGQWSFTTIPNPGSVAPLPPGYEYWNNVVYNVSTTAVVGGPILTTFRVPSVSGQDLFNTLRTLHAESDPFDPEATRWVDRTVLAPSPDAPNFATRTINARLEDLGKFLIARKVSTPNIGTADISVNMTASPTTVMSENELTYSITVSNTGPQEATNVGLRQTLSTEVAKVSVSTTQGSCKFVEWQTYCKLGNIANGQSVNITVIVRPIEGSNPFPAAGETIHSSVFAQANELDANLGNNGKSVAATALPNSNQRPEANIISPTTPVVGKNIVVKATASDPDGTIAEVKFYDGPSLLGTGTRIGASNEYQIALSNLSFGNHVLAAVASDNNGRLGTSAPKPVFVNGEAVITLTAPNQNAVLTPGSTTTITATITQSAGSNIREVEFFDGDQSIGVAPPNGPFNMAWSNIARGIHTLSVKVTDDANVITISTPLSVTATVPPTSAISTPANNASFPPSSNVTIIASVQDNDGFVEKVEFYANNLLLGSTQATGTQARFVWERVPDGIYSIVAIATDDLGISTTSSPSNITVNNAPPAPDEIVWLDDALPPGSGAYAENDVWQWVNSNPAPILGNAAHQSKIAAGQHQHNFDGATIKLPVNAGDTLYTYVFIDPDHIPREIMLQWYDGASWEHRAYWGENLMGFAANGTNGQRRIGSLPTKSGTWIRLEAPAAQVGLEGKLVSGMAFTLYDGGATWDRAGKFSAPPGTTYGPEVIWVDDALPTGAVSNTEDDCWCWETSGPAPFHGAKFHRTFPANQTNKHRFHSFTGAAPLEIKPGDVLFTYVYIDPAAKPDTLLLEFYDGTSWNHRAFWGRNYSQHGGLTGTENRRYMGDLPPAGQWVRLEIPASYVGLEGQAITGMSFGAHKEAGGARNVSWDYTGKTSVLQTTPRPLNATTPLFRFYKQNNGPKRYRLSTVNVGFNEVAQGIKGYLFAYQAPGTVPLYRFIESGPNQRYFYGTCRNCPTASLWNYEGIEGYVYPTAGVPGAVPLHRYQRNGSGYSEGYYYTLDRVSDGDSIPGMVYEGIAAFVFDAPSPAPNAPSGIGLAQITNQSGGGNGYNLNWLDNSLDETGFLLEKASGAGADFLPLATLAPNTTLYGVGAPRDFAYRVRSFNAQAASAYLEIAGSIEPPLSPATANPPQIAITNPLGQAVTGREVLLTANASDADGAGSVLKVEFFEGNNKIGETKHAPYGFYWRNIPLGTHTITAKATDNKGMTTVSAPVTFVVYDFR
jgi:uncharacterized repeat protein (TIGR01451 family)